MKERVGEQDWSREEDDEVLREREGGKVDKGEVEEGGEEEQGRHLDGEGAAAWVKRGQVLSIWPRMDGERAE